jgi:hypothetical protein
MLAAGMRTPVAAIAFATELPNSANPAILAMLLALGGAMLTAGQLDKRSIYSARLPARYRADDRRPRPDAPKRSTGTIRRWSQPLRPRPRGASETTNPARATARRTVHAALRAAPSCPSDASSKW